MALDTEIESWENVGSIDYAVSPPKPEGNNGHIYVRGEPEALKEFFCAFFTSKGRNADEFERLYSSYFQALSQAEAKKEQVDRLGSEVNLSSERFYLRSRFEYGGEQVRPKPILDYLNRYSANNFKDMERQFAAALEKYKCSVR